MADINYADRQAAIENLEQYREQILSVMRPAEPQAKDLKCEEVLGRLTEAVVRQHGELLRRAAKGELSYVERISLCPAIGRLSTKLLAYCDSQPRLPWIVIGDALHEINAAIHDLENPKEQ